MDLAKIRAGDYDRYLGNVSILEWFPRQEFEPRGFTKKSLCEASENALLVPVLEVRAACVNPPDLGAARFSPRVWFPIILKS